VSDTGEQIRELLRVEDGISAVQVVAKLDLDPDEWLGEVKEIMDEASEGVWADCDFQTPESGVYPSDLLDRQQWMGRFGKLPFAPWGDQNAPAECNRSDCPADYADEPECECDARFKWSHEPLYVDGETVAMAEEDERLDGRVFIQTDDDPYGFIDGDNVRCPETGRVHPEFVEILNQLGVSYADISTSGSGVHVNYRGDLPAGVPEVDWVIDDEPWGENDDKPAIEIYANKHVCVATGDHVPGSGTDIEEWDNGALEDLLDERDLLRQPSEEGSSFDLENHDADATTSEETTGDIRDIYAALDQIDARQVADDTIVAEWFDDSGEHRAFRPAWASHDYDGEAVFANNHVFKDSGRRGGKGGPACMAAIDAGLVRDTNCPEDVNGETWFEALEHLRELGYDIPRYETDTIEIPESSVDVDADDSEEPPAADAGEEEAQATDGGAAAADADSDTGPDTETADAPEADHTIEESWEDIREMFRKAEDNDDREVPRFESAMKLYREHDFATLRENDQLYAYDPSRGIYNDNGEGFVREHLTRGLEEQYRSHTKSEVLDHLRGRTVVPQDEMGGDEGLIAAENCVIDLNETTSKEHGPQYRFLSRLGCEFDPDATAPRFHEFLEEVVPSSTEREKLQEFAGYTLMHWGLPYHKALFLVGPTASGKSTFLDTIRAMLGSETVASLTPQQLTSERFAGAELHGKWANIRNDIPASTVKNTGAFKEITAGDPMKAERKRKDPFMFEPTAKHLFAANELPSTETDDEAFYRRVLLVAFPETIPERDRDKHLDDKLQDELPGVLNWAIEGLQRLLGNGKFTADRSPGRTQDTWSKWADSVTRFKKAAVEDGDDDIPKSEMFAAYLQYCREEGIPSDTQHKMTRELKAAGLEDGRAYVDGGGRERCFLNVNLTSRGEQLLENAGKDTDDDPEVEDRKPTGIEDWD